MNNETETFTNNAYHYIRWSTPVQGKPGHDSKRRQMSPIADVCKSYGLKLVATFTDDGVSAFRGKNKNGKLKEILTIIKPGDTLIIEDLDRLQREDPKTARRYIEDLVDDKGVRIISQSGGNPITKAYMSTLGGRMETEVRLALAYEESKKKADRTKEIWIGKRKDIADGKMIRITHRPTWLDWTTNGYIINEEKANIVRRIFSLYNKGRGANSISKLLNDEKVQCLTALKQDGSPRKNFSGWTETMVQRILTSKAVMGLCEYTKPPSKLFPPIVDEKIFWSAMSKRAERKKKSYRGKGKTSFHPFRTLLKCSLCGGGCYNDDCRCRTKIKGKIYRSCHQYLKCYNRKHNLCKIKKGSNMKYIRYDAFEKSFVEILKLDYISKLLMGESKSVSNLEILNGQLSDCQKQQQKITALILGDADPSVNLVRELKEMESKEKKLIQEINTETLLVSGTSAPSEDLLKYKKEFDGKFTDPNYRREIAELLRGFIERIVLDFENGQYDIYFKGSDNPIRVKLEKQNGFTIENIQFPNTPLKPLDAIGIRSFTSEYSLTKGRVFKITSKMPPLPKNVVL